MRSVKTDRLKRIQDRPGRQLLQFSNVTPVIINLRSCGNIFDTKTAYISELVFAIEKGTAKDKKSKIGGNSANTFHYFQSATFFCHEYTIRIVLYEKSAK